MEIDTFYQKCNTYLVSNIVEVEQQNFFFLTEGDDYRIKIRKKEDSKIILIRPDKIKEKATYLKQKPKDCDYILIDFSNNSIFLVEVKRKNSTSGLNDVKQQLVSGKFWFDHITFITGTKNIFKNFKVFLVELCSFGRQDRKSIFQKNQGVYKFNTSDFDLREFIRKTKGDNVTMENFEYVI